MGKKVEEEAGRGSRSGSGNGAGGGMVGGGIGGWGWGWGWGAGERGAGERGAGWGLRIRAEVRVILLIHRDANRVVNPAHAPSIGLSTPTRVRT
jgi:hypothetical protein